MYFYILNVEKHSTANSPCVYRYNIVGFLNIHSPLTMIFGILKAKVPLESITSPQCKMTSSHNLCNLASATSEFWVNCCQKRDRVFRWHDQYIITNLGCWRAAVYAHLPAAFHCFWWVGSVAVDSHDESCDHCLYSTWWPRANINDCFAW